MELHLAPLCVLYKAGFEIREVMSLLRVVGCRIMGIRRVLCY